MKGLTSAAEAAVAVPFLLEERRWKQLKDLAREAGQTIRAAIKNWPATVRTVCLVVAGTAAMAGYHLVTAR
jgi:hypothetical protein